MLFMKQSKFDDTFTEEEIKLIEALAEVSIKKGLLCSEKELFAILRS
jgi:hypothetical protein